MKFSTLTAAVLVAAIAALSNQAAAALPASSLIDVKLHSGGILVGIVTDSAGLHGFRRRQLTEDGVVPSGKTGPGGSDEGRQGGVANDGRRRRCQVVFVLGPGVAQGELR